MPKIQVEVQGFTPYYFNRQVEGPVPKTVEQNVQRAIDLVYCKGDRKNSFKIKDINGSFGVNKGDLFMPANQFRGSMRNAMSLFKMKIEKSNKRAIDFLNASVFIEPSWLEFNPKLNMKNVQFEKKWIITDSAKGTGIEKYFSFIPEGWELQFEIEHAGLIDISFLEDALIKGGLYCGVGGRRIHKSGRYEVKKFKVV